ncbi:hypothetical protein LPJ81_001094 [Coemansia sp. IMI 209127]|nr:hypothetical protein LPJ81_001094 [Coemansia sp. IMI 209127]
MNSSLPARLQGVLASQAPRPTSKHLRPYKRCIQTSAVLSKVKLGRLKKLVSYVTEQALAKEPLIDKRPEEKPSIIQRLNSMNGKGGDGVSARMHLRVLLNDNDAEQAWKIWSTKCRQGDSLNTAVSAEEMTKLLLLLVNSSTSRQSVLFADPARRTEEDHNRRKAASFRISMVLRFMFSRAIRTSRAGQLDSAPDSAQELAAVSFETADLRLGVLEQYDYEAIVQLLALSVDSSMPTGNTETPASGTTEDLAIYVQDVSVVRLIQAVLCAALQDGKEITHEMLHVAIEAATAVRDTTAARDILRLCYPDLAKLLDPKDVGSVIGSSNSAFADPSSKSSRRVVELALRLVSVGYDPQATEITAQAAKEQQDGSYKQFEDICAYGESQSVDPSENAATHQWRTDTVERIYRAFISSGIKEIPSPENSQQRALQGSVVPSLSMITSLLDVYCKAGNIEQATVLYDALISHLPQLGPKKQNPASAADYSQKTGAQNRPVLSVGMWMDIFNAVRTSGQFWLTARVLGDMVQDMRNPTSKMYQNYLMLTTDRSKDNLVHAMDLVKQSILGGGVSALNRGIRSPLICALCRTGLNIPADNMMERVEQAIALSGLPLTKDDARAADASTKSIAVTLMNPKRRIISALMYTGQVSRAQEMTELWSTECPDLVSGKKIAELIEELGNAGEHKEALRMFMDYQQIAHNEITVDILCAVLKVYVHAGDYTEALSVGKRLRAMVNDAPEADRRLLLPHRDVYEMMIRVCCEQALAAEALRILEEMRSYRLNATSETYATLARMMGRLRSYDGIKLITALAHVDYNMGAIAYIKKSHENLWHSSEALPLTVDYYNALIEAYGRVAEPTKAIQCWELMRIRGVKPDNLTATLLFDICGWNERVHWDEDMVMHDEFVELEVPDDHVFTGVPFFHLHFLATILIQLEEAGLELSLTNYRHLIEAMLRYGLFEDVLAMTIGKHEDPALTARYEEESKVLLDRGMWSVFTVLGSFVKRAKGEENVKPREPKAKFMESLPIDIPLCKETVHTIYGMIASLRVKCVPEEGVDPPDLPFAQQMSPNLFKRLSISEERLDNILYKHRPDLVPKQKLESFSIWQAEQEQSG